MKWNSMGRSAKALAVSLAMILGVSACSRDYTVAYLYVTAKTAATTGLIDAYAIDYQSGSLLPLADSPIPSGGKNPVAVAVMPDGSGLFVINHDDSTVVSFNIGTDGKLYPQATYNTTGSFPTALAVDSQGKFLYVAYTYENGYTTASPGPGGISVFPITEGSNPTVVTLGTPVNYNLGNNPVGIAVSKVTTTQANAYVLAIDQEKNSAGTPIGVIRVFQQGKTNGVANSTLTAITATGAASYLPAYGGFAAGTLPGSIVIDPTGQFVYVSDESTNQIYGNLMISGVLTAMNTSPFLTGQLPEGMTIDPRGEYLFVANYNSNTVGSYTISATNGALTATGTAAVATGPTCVTMENALGKYLFSSNQLDDSVSGEVVDPHTGSMSAIEGTQFTASHLPTCAAAIANGSHATALTVN